MSLINRKNHFKKNFKFNTEEDIYVERFHIDGDFTYLNIKFSSWCRKKPVIYLMLIDSDNVLRLQYRSIRSKENLVVCSESDKCSIGTYPGIIKSGEWTLIVAKDKEKRKYDISIEASDELKNQDIDKIGDDLWVDYSKEDRELLSLNNYDWNKSFNEECRWYKGDFHTHTILSDGKMNNELYIDTAKKMNMDFAVSTEHNIVPTGWKKDDSLLIIPGTEVTMYDGHFNILGIREFPLGLKLEKIIDSYDKKISHEMQETIVKEIVGSCRDERALYSVNHMVLEFWKWKFLNIRLDRFDTIEICNDPTYYLGAESNDRVIRMLDILWNDGYKIFGIGGSDAHILPDETYDNSKERSILGDPGTFVYCDELTADKVIDSVRNGHVYVSRGLILDMNIKSEGSGISKSYLPGDEIEINDYAQINYSLNVRLENIENEYGRINETNMPLKVYFIENGVRTEKVIEEEGNVDFTVRWNKGEYKYLSVEIRDMEDRFRGFINPVYHGHRKHELITFGDLFEKSNITHK